MLEIASRSLFCLLGICQSCGSPDSEHSCIYVCYVTGEEQNRLFCGECLSQHNITNMKLNYGVMLEPTKITWDDIDRMKNIYTTREDFPNHWAKVCALKIAVPIMGAWYWIAGTDPNYWLNEQ